MAKRKPRNADRGKADKTPAPDRAAPHPQTAADQVVASNLSLHDLFQQQAATMLDRADISEEQKQSIMIAMSCPCCGAGGMSFTAKLKRGR